MKPDRFCVPVARVLFALFAAIAVAAPVHAARVGVLSNKYATETAADFNVRIPTHVFTPIDTSLAIPTLQSLTNAFDVVLVFEDSTYGNATAVGDALAAFASTGHAVVVGAFYDQDRSDGPAINSPHGWGALEQLDPNTTDRTGTPYAPRTLNTATMLRHALTTGVTALSSAKFAGGNLAKPGTTVVAYWTQPNAQGQPDPAIAFRITSAACVIQLAIAPNYAVIGAAGTDYDGDFHRAWKNAFDFGANRCVSTSGNSDTPDPFAIPTLSAWGLLLTMLLVGAGAVFRRGRRAR
jgi:exosortase sorting signal-containing protein